MDKITCRRCGSVLTQRYDEEPHCPQCGWVAWDYKSTSVERRSKRWEQNSEIAHQDVRRGKPPKDDNNDEEE